jgi:hypothetical protein
VLFKPLQSSLDSIVADFLHSGSDCQLADMVDMDAELPHPLALVNVTRIHAH